MNRLKACLFLPCTCIVAGLILSPPMLAGTADDDTDKVFVGYVFRRPEKINFDLYTHLCHAFLVADEEGNVLPRRSVPNRDLTDEAHRAGVKVLLSLGGWGWDRQFATMVTKSDAEDRYVQSVMSIVDEYASTKDAPNIRVPRGSFNNLRKLQEEGWTRQWDNETKNPWLISPDRSVVIGYDDEEAVSIKTAWAMKKGFRGVFFWQIAADLLPDGTHPLQEASRKKWEMNVQQER